MEQRFHPALLRSSVTPRGRARLRQPSSASRRALDCRETLLEPVSSKIVWTSLTTSSRRVEVRRGELLADLEQVRHEVGHYRPRPRRWGEHEVGSPPYPFS